MDSSANSKPVEAADASSESDLEMEMEELELVFDRMTERYQQIRIQLNSIISRRTQLELNIQTFITDAANQENGDFTHAQIAIMDNLLNERQDIIRTNLELTAELEQLEPAFASVAALLDRIREDIDSS